MGGMKTHKDLNVWKEAMNLVKDVYSLTKDFPKEEVYGLVSQMRRAAVSIPSNIAEGAARNSSKEFTQFLYTALGSLAELETQFLLSKELGFAEGSKIEEDIERIRKMLFKLFEKKLEQKFRSSLFQRLVGLIRHLRRA